MPRADNQHQASHKELNYIKMLRLPDGFYGTISESRYSNIVEVLLDVPPQMTARGRQGVAMYAIRVIPDVSSCASLSLFTSPSRQPEHQIEVTTDTLLFSEHFLSEFRLPGRIDVLPEEMENGMRMSFSIPTASIPDYIK